MASKTFYNKETKIWHGETTEPLYKHQDSIGSVFLKSVLQNPDHITQIGYESGKHLTNRELAQRSIQAAKHFQKLKLMPGDLITMCVENSDNVAPLFFGALLNGLCVYGINPRFNKEGIQRVCALAQPKLMICDGDTYQKVREALVEANLPSTAIYTERIALDGVANTEEFFAEAMQSVEDFKVPTLKQGSDHVAAIVCTSGSTGHPKGVTISHGSLLNCFSLSHIPIEVNVSNSRTFCSRALYSLNGLIILVHATLNNVTRVISENPFCADTFVDIVNLYKINFITCFPPYLSLIMASSKLVNNELSSLRLCGLAGCTVQYSLIEKFRKFAPNAIFINSYSTSETCFAITSDICDPSDSVGRLRPNIEVKIIDDHGTPIGPNEIGEICIRTKFPWAGYFRNPQATSLAYDKERWYHTDDLGYFNDDGQLYLKDRKSDILKYGAFYFAPSNIEKVIRELPEIMDVCVVGYPDSIYGSLPAAAVVKQPGCSLDASQIRQHVAERMQHYEHLHGGVYFFESLPQNLAGKIHRREIAKLCQASVK